VVAMAKSMVGEQEPTKVYFIQNFIEQIAYCSQIIFVHLCTCDNVTNKTMQKDENYRRCHLKKSLKQFLCTSADFDPF
jgi:hypothetical protein